VTTRTSTCPRPCGRVWDFSRDGVRRSLEAGLTRLGLDRVDVVYLHDPDAHWQVAAVQGCRALAELRDEGVVRAFGVGLNQTAMLARLVRETGVDVVLVAGRYSLLDRSAADELTPLALERGVGLVVAASYNSGLLATASSAAGRRRRRGKPPTGSLPMCRTRCGQRSTCPRRRRSPRGTGSATDTPAVARTGVRCV
jgi:D-threo-aldose 1-dehydrogenase